jgi:hypothetical protein
MPASAKDEGSGTEPGLSDDPLPGRAKVILPLPAKYSSFANVAPLEELP